MSRHRKFNLLAWLAMGLTVAMLGLLIYWSIVPFKPILEIPNNKLNVVVPEVKAGEDLLLNYSVCKNGDYTGVVTRYIEDNQVIALPDIVSKFPAGCHNYTLPVTIPINAPTDTYIFHAQITYKVSPIKSVTYDFYSDKFKVDGKIL